MKQFQTILLISLALVSKTFLSEAETRLYNEKHLSSSLTTAVAQDNNGFIWIGTEYGLNRYDGITFKTYYHDDKDVHSIRSNIVRSLFNDKEGRLWVGYLNGLQFYDPETDEFKNISFSNLNRTPNVSEIYQLNSGKIWITVSRLGIYEVDTENRIATHISQISELCGTRNILSVYEDDNGRIWVSTSGNGIICLNHDLTKVLGTYLTDIQNQTNGKISQNKDNILILSHGEALWMFDEVHKEFVMIPPPLQEILPSLYPTFFFERMGIS